MARGLSIQVTGLKELRAKFGSLPKNLTNEVDAEMHASADDFVARAVQSAPVDTSLLRQGISQKRLGTMHYEVVSAAPYSAYVEFGTITKVQVPTDLVEFALLFKGRGIKKNGGLIARPFFFKQREPVYQALQQRLQPAIEKALNK